MFKMNHDVADLIGIPFVDGGRDFSGCDCWGMVCLFYRHMHGVTLPDYQISCFDTVSIKDTIENETEAVDVWEPIQQPEPSCLIVMATNTDFPDFCSHLGVCLPEQKFLHTLRKKNSYIERLHHPFFKTKIKMFLRYVGK